MLSGARSLYAIAQFGRGYGPQFAKALGFTKGKTPCCTALRYLFKQLNPGQFERAIRSWLRGRQKNGWKAVAIDGKSLRGTQGHQLPGVHLLAAYAHQAKAALAQLSVPGYSNEHKAALQLLDIIALKDTVVTGDAMFCQKCFSGKVLRKGGHYIWPVKDNQSQLKEQVVMALDDRSLCPSAGSTGSARTAARQ
jgi:hypothetical protein